MFVSDSCLDDLCYNKGLIYFLHKVCIFVKKTCAIVILVPTYARKLKTNGR